MDNKNNTGNYNTGYYNTGDYNTGHYNTGSHNTGHYNTGDSNTGRYNTGYYNTGDYNTGRYNTGRYNTGDYNTGYSNTGDYNTGHYNTGYSNTGHYNTGHYNTGDYNTGFFCTETPKAILFDQPSDLTHDQVRELLPYIELSISCQWVDQSKMTHQEKKDNPNWAAMGGYLKKINKSIRETFPIWWESTTQENRDKFLNLPNFDAEKFLKCTGVDVRKDEKANFGVDIDFLVNQYREMLIQKYKKN
jgi:hypothetical protein